MNKQPSGKLANPFTALKNRNYLIYWICICFSMVGTWMQNIAQPWLVYKLTGSPFLLGLTGALQYTPVLIFSLYAGAVIDRFPKKKLILITQFASFVVTLVPAILIWTGHIRYEYILACAAILGLINTFDMPARHTFVTEIVGPRYIRNAIALNSVVFNSARVVGPALAGLIMGAWGVAFCYFLNSLSFLVLFTGIFFVKQIVAVPVDFGSRQHIFDDIKDGLVYLGMKPMLLETILLVTVVATFAMNMGVLVPVYTKSIIGGNESTFGLIMSFMGGGSLCAALLVAATSHTTLSKWSLWIPPPLMGLVIITMGFSNSFLAMAVLIFLTGFLFVSFSSNSNSTIQMTSSDKFRGRVMSIYTLVFAGSTPIGNLYAGFFADRFGPRSGFLACGIVILVLYIVLCFFRFVYNSKSKNRGV
ncbi:MAG TPA: MFS transporter [Chitinispirillaceae bacterium]|nr:MFS transporter [Chitinispirillaceae bacterium]